MKKIKLALICTIGGHFEQMLNLRNFYSEYEYFWITNKGKHTEYEIKDDKKYFIEIAHFTEPWKYIVHIPFFIKILISERPTHIVSTGSASSALIPYLISKVLNIKFVFIDTFSRVKKLSNFGKFVYLTGTMVYIQWEKPGLKNTFYIGPVFEKQNNKHTASKEGDTIFVSLGNRKHQFYRLLDYIVNLIDRGIITEKVIIQAGFTRYNSTKMKIFDFCSPYEIDNYIAFSKFVITQESAGLATKCLKLNKKFIVVPRDYKFNELPTQSDMEEDLQYKLEELGYTKVATNLNELENAIKNLDELKVGFEFDNTYALNILKSTIEGEK